MEEREIAKCGRFYDTIAGCDRFGLLCTSLCLFFAAVTFVFNIFDLKILTGISLAVSLLCGIGGMAIDFKKNDLEWQEMMDSIINSMEEEKLKKQNA